MARIYLRRVRGIFGRCFDKHGRDCYFRDGYKCVDLQNKGKLPVCDYNFILLIQGPRGRESE